MEKLLRVEKSYLFSVHRESNSQIGWTFMDEIYYLNNQYVTTEAQTKIKINIIVKLIGPFLHSKFKIFWVEHFCELFLCFWKLSIVHRYSSFVHITLQHLFILLILVGIHSLLLAYNRVINVYHENGEMTILLGENVLSLNYPVIPISVYVIVY